MTLHNPYDSHSYRSFATIGHVKMSHWLAGVKRAPPTLSMRREAARDLVRCGVSYSFFSVLLLFLLHFVPYVWHADTARNAPLATVKPVDEHDTSLAAISAQNTNLQMPIRNDVVQVNNKHLAVVKHDSVKSGQPPKPEYPEHTVDYYNTVIKKGHQLEHDAAKLHSKVPSSMPFQFTNPPNTIAPDQSNVVQYRKWFDQMLLSSLHQDLTLLYMNSKKDDHLKMFFPGVLPLYNPNNQCYSNSTLQLLFSSMAVNEFFLNTNPGALNELNETKYLATEMRKLLLSVYYKPFRESLFREKGSRGGFAEMWAELVESSIDNEMALNAENFRTAAAIANEVIAGFGTRQNDAEEYLNNLISSFPESFQSKIQLHSLTIRNHNHAEWLSKGFEVDETKSDWSNKPAADTMLQLSLSNFIKTKSLQQQPVSAKGSQIGSSTVSIHDLIYNDLSHEAIEWRCDDVKTDRVDIYANCTKRKLLNFAHAPESLFVQLKRYDYINNKIVKLQDTVHIDMMLMFSAPDLTQLDPESVFNLPHQIQRIVDPKSFTVDVPEGHVAYRFSGAVKHMGRSSNSGHYVALTRNLYDGAWYFYDDQNPLISLQPTLQATASPSDVSDWLQRNRFYETTLLVLYNKVNAAGND